MDQFLSFDLKDTIFAEGRRWYIDEFTYNTTTRKAKCVLRSKEPKVSRASIDEIKSNGQIVYSDDRIV